jgi:hypothetical protein
MTGMAYGGAGGRIVCQGRPAPIRVKPSVVVGWNGQPAYKKSGAGGVASGTGHAIDGIKDRRGSDLCMVST